MGCAVVEGGGARLGERGALHQAERCPAVSHPLPHPSYPNPPLPQPKNKEIVFAVTPILGARWLSAAVLCCAVPCAMLRLSLFLVLPVPSISRGQLLALSYTFLASTPGVQSIVSTMLCVTYLAVQMAAQPLRHPSAQRQQTLLLYCLVAVALSGVPTAVVREEAGNSSSRNGMRAALSTLVHWLHTVGGLMGPAAAVLVAHWGMVGKVRQIGARLRLWCLRCTALGSVEALVSSA